MESKSEQNESRSYRKLPKWLSLYERRVIGSLLLGATWEEGRQGTGYEKSNLVGKVNALWAVNDALKQIGNPKLFDAWLLRYPVGSEITGHTDPALDGMCHVRLNALIVAGTGGSLYLDGKELPLSEGDAYIFRPDSVYHRVSAIEGDTRLVLSVGASMELEQAQALNLA